ncbi:hypothetical protein OU798_19925 [Prolixibacteraceae bacterium Z1-6]|uniref:Tetratricopeptide repeat protein n=1 Tax=Draconibacterium aestuarii TaxID=2998507 RepID=A0A9X3F8Q3_9BACT|nr:hypothetical protein [Prolixibacteraceae bacterium Z1-6]
MKKVGLLFVAVFITVFSFAQDAAEKMNQANEALQNKEYVKALELYQEVLAIPDHGQDVEGITSTMNQLKPVIAKDEASDAIDNKEYDKAVEIYKTAMTEFPDDASIASQAGVKFYNAGITSYKAKSYLEAAKCFTIAEMDFKNDKAEKYKNASLKKVAEDLAAEGKTSVEEVEVCAENKALLINSLASAYVMQGNDLYKQGAAILSAANQKVNDGGMTTADDAYAAEVAKAKKEFTAAIEVLEKALALDANNANATKLLEACKSVI